MKINEAKKVQTGIFPTPLTFLETISKETGTNIFIKRDDLDGLAFGGNKLRKLDYIIKEAKEDGCTVLLTYGAVQTNHGRLTAAAGCKYGMKTVILAYSYEDVPEKLSGNLLLDAIMDCEVVFMDSVQIKKDSLNCSAEETDLAYQRLEEKALKETIERYEKMGEKVYVMPGGGSNATGGAGYVEAVHEIMEQLEEMKQPIDYIVCANGSLGTFCGLWAGIRYYKAPFEVIGVNVLDYPDIDELVCQHILEISDKYELNLHPEVQELHITNDYCGVGYNVPDEKTYETIYRLARKEGIFLDPAYTGKAFTGLLGMLEDGTIPQNSNVLFLHTGGLPGIYNEQHINQFTEDLWTEKLHYTVYPNEINERK